MGGAGGAAGVLLGGVLTDLLSWRWILFINVPIGLLAAMFAQRYIPDGRDVSTERRSFDLAGAISATVGLSVLVFGIVRTDVTGWGAVSTLAMLSAGVILLALFVAIEARFARSPLMPLRIYASRTLSAANMVVLLVGAATFAMWFFLSLYVQQVLGYSPLRAGLAFLPMTLCIVAGSTFASRAVTRVGPKPMLVAGMALQAVGLILLTRIAPGGSYLGDLLVPTLLIAAGIGLSFVPVTIAAVSGVASHEAGLASGLVNTSRLVGGALGLAILAALATSRTNDALHHGAAAHAALTNGFVLAFGIAAAFSAVGALIALVGLPRVSMRRARQTIAVESA
jgi:MFS family permease